MKSSSSLWIDTPRYSMIRLSIGYKFYYLISSTHLSPDQIFGAVAGELRLIFTFLLFFLFYFVIPFFNCKKTIIHHPLILLFFAIVYITQITHNSFIFLSGTNLVLEPV